MKLLIDGKCFNDKLELHKYLAHELRFPDYYGENLDALYDVMMDINEDLIIEATNMEGFPGFVDVFNDLVEDNKHISFNLK